jgi:HSP20 family protein
MNRLMDEAFGQWATPFEDGTVASAWVPPVDVFESQEQVKLVAELPGVRPENVNISLENNVLTLRGEKQQVAEEKTDRVHRYERVYGQFERTFTLPSTVDADNIQANYEHGVLTILLPKLAKARPREIPVTVK